KDFNFNPVRDKINPLLVMHRDNDFHWSYHTGSLYMSIRIDPSAIQTSADIQNIVEDVQSKVKATEPSLIFQYTFLDEDFDSAFKSEYRMGTVLNLFTGLAVIIACLGLFGLAAFSAEQRMKELGIRKVLGAK